MRAGDDLESGVGGGGTTTAAAAAAGKIETTAEAVKKRMSVVLNRQPQPTTTKTTDENTAKKSDQPAPTKTRPNTAPAIILDVKEQDKRNREIDRVIEEEKLDSCNVIKILLLGTAGCGKSTVFKQMKILHCDGFSDLYIGHCRALIHNNTIMSMQQLLAAANTFDIEVQDPYIEEFLTSVPPNTFQIHELTPELGKVIEYLWNNPILRDMYNKRRDEFQIMDSAKYFLDKVIETSAADYRPSNDDILRSRVATTGATTIEFAYKETKLKLTDVGGNRSEMKKWVHFFDDVETILFISALSDYDQWSDDYEQPVNKLTLSLEVFNRICRTEVFHSAAFILFLNKMDVFDEKIERRIFSNSHPDYEGPSSDGSAIKLFIRDEFAQLAGQTGHGDKLYAHFTNATDTNNVDRVFEVCMDIVIEDNMKGSGFT